MEYIKENKEFDWTLSDSLFEEFEPEDYTLIEWSEQ